MESTINLSATDRQFAAVTEMINAYVASTGLEVQKTFNPELKNWRWMKGSANIEVFINRLHFGDGLVRDFIKVFSPIMEIPANNQADFFRRLLELNDEKLGVKITVQKGSNRVWATFERDILGMDQEEVITFLCDFEIWADHLDDLLLSEFPVAVMAPMG